MSMPAAAAEAAFLIRNVSLAFAHTWSYSPELRVAVFVLILQCCFMIWATVLVREIARTATTVLCKLLVYDSEASIALGNRTGYTSMPASEQRTRHRTAGGPPPGLPPPDVHQPG